MTKKEFLELFYFEGHYVHNSEGYLPLDNGFSIKYYKSHDEFYINYQEDFQDYDGYVIEVADEDLRITFKMAFELYEISKR